AEDEDGRGALPDEASAEGRYRNGAPRPRLQSHPGDEHHGHPAANGRDPSIVNAEKGNPPRHRPRGYSVWKRPRPIADVGGKVADTTRTPFHQSEFFALLFS